jgi:hypothetical protein
VEGERSKLEADLGPVRYLATLLGAGDQDVLRYFNSGRGAAAGPGRSALAACRDQEAMKLHRGTGKSAPVLMREYRPDR